MKFKGAGAASKVQRARELSEPAHTITGGQSAAWIHEGRATDVPRPQLPGNNGGGGVEND